MRIRKEIGSAAIVQILNACRFESDYDIIAETRSSMNQMLTIAVANQTLFLKCSSARVAKKMLKAEFEGLSALREAGVTVPGYVNHGVEEGWSWLLMEFISNVSPDKKLEEEGGRQLALLHRTTSDQFGWETDNYISSLKQSNTLSENWWRFYCDERLLAQLEMTIDKLPLLMRKQLERIILQGVNVFPDEKPALCHGDLWSGNRLYTKEGKAYLIDPAIYFGHREMDIGMTKLFGGFGDDYYRSYEMNYPLEQGWEKRVSITTLYPLLVHVNLFGASYLGLLQEAIQLTEIEVL